MDFHIGRSLRSVSFIGPLLTFIPCAASADVIAGLLNHGAGNAGPDYGLRIDNGSVATFNFEAFDTGSSVEMRFHTDTNSASIFGTVKHNQSGQFWDVSATLDMHVFTDDGSDWRTNTSGNFYDHMIRDFEADADNADSRSETELKTKATSADRIGFEFVELNMTLQSGQGDAVYTLDGDTDGSLTLFDYPQDTDLIPFILAKGHRLGSDSEEIAGFGWLDPTHPDHQTGGRGDTRDFLFRLGEWHRVPEPSVPLLLGAALAALALTRRVVVVR